MKRRLFKLALFLLIGAVVNVAVAWSCVVVELGYEVESVLLSEHEQAWLQITGEEPDPRRSGPPVDATEGFGWEKRTIPLRDDQLVKFLETVFGIPRGLVWPTFESIRGGWPFHCLSGETGVHGTPEQLDRQFTFHVYGTSVQLPVRPIWKGFIANTLIYALILWVLAPQLRTMSIKAVAFCRQHFHKRGHCIKCGYDLRETPDKCPECGWGR